MSCRRCVIPRPHEEQIAANLHHAQLSDVGERVRKRRRQRRRFAEWQVSVLIDVGPARTGNADGVAADIEVVVTGGRIVGIDNASEFQAGPETKVIDLRGKRVIPGLYDSHLHVIRGGLNYNMELRWEGVPSVSIALAMLREQAARTPAPQWVRVVGGWSEFQFAEKRMPTLEEINAAAPDTPVFILHLYCRALLNRAALRACGYTKDTPNPPGGEIE